MMLERASGRDTALTLVRSFRLGITGLCLVGVTLGIAWQLPSLLGLSLIVGIEEILETSVVIGALRGRGLVRLVDK